MTAYLLAGPAAEPVTRAEAKAYLRLDDEAEDALVDTLITAARLHVEGTTAQAMIAQSWRLVRDAWPTDGTVKLPVAPLMSLTAVTAYDEAGTAHPIAIDQFEIDAATPRLLLPSEVEGMPALRRRQGIEIDYVAGHGETGADVPADLRQAVLALCAYWFEHRDAAVVSATDPVAPTGFDRLIANYRRARL